MKSYMMLSTTAGTLSCSWVPMTPNQNPPGKDGANNSEKEKAVSVRESEKNPSGIKVMSGQNVLQAGKEVRKERKGRKARKGRKERKSLGHPPREIGHQIGPLPSGVRQSASNTTRTGLASMATTAGSITTTAYRKNPMDNPVVLPNTKARIATCRQRRERRLD